MGRDIDDAYRRFLHIKAELKTSLSVTENESDTRLRILDRLLIEVIGWNRDYILTEPPTPDGYIDYLLRLDGQRSLLVIEAKRNGRLAPDTQNGSISFLSLTGRVLSPLSSAVKQALRYAGDEGVPFAAISDGNTWLFFKASRQDGRKPAEGQAILFRSLDTIEASFPIFFELCAPIALRERHNLVHLNKAEGLTLAPVEHHFFVSESSHAKLLPSTTLSSDASLMFAQFFNKMTDEKNEQMMSDCFVESLESRKAGKQESRS